MIPEKGKVYEINYYPRATEDMEAAYRGKATCLSSEPDPNEDSDGNPLYEFSIENGDYSLFTEEDIIKEA